MLALISAWAIVPRKRGSVSYSMSDYDTDGIDHYNDMKASVAAALSEESDVFASSLACPGCGISAAPHSHLDAIAFARNVFAKFPEWARRTFPGMTGDEYRRAAVIYLQGAKMAAIFAGETEGSYGITVASIAQTLDVLNRVQSSLDDSVDPMRERTGR